MKVIENLIDINKEEFISLNIYKKTNDTESLKRYVEQEGYIIKTIFCNLDNKKISLALDEIFLIEVYRGITTLYTNTQSFTNKSKLFELEKIFPPNFMRISKSSIINFNKITVFEPLANGLMKVTFTNNTNAYISRKYLRECRLLIRRLTV